MQRVIKSVISKAIRGFDHSLTFNNSLETWCYISNSIQIKHGSIIHLNVSPISILNISCH